MKAWSGTCWWRMFRRDDEGVVMVEAILAVPFLTLLTVGILEFGSAFWQRHQIETGLRDAARYMARCRHSQADCELVARNLAYYGTSATGTTLRVPNWKPSTGAITFVTTTVGAQKNIEAGTTQTLVHSPLFGWLGIDDITVTLDHNERIIGW